MLDLDFKLHKTQREVVIENVNNGSLSPNVVHNSSLINLENRYPVLSAGGNEIVVEQHEGLKYVFFFTFRGILDNYAGFLYVPNGGKPTECSDLNESRGVEIKHLKLIFNKPALSQGRAGMICIFKEAENSPSRSCLPAVQVS